MIQTINAQIGGGWGWGSREFVYGSAHEVLANTELHFIQCKPVFLSTYRGRVFAPRGLAHENFIRTRQESVAFGHNT